MIHVLIERHIAESMLSTYEENSKQVLQKTYMVPGFISGESFIDTQEPNHRYLLCKWRSIQDWYRWAQSEERKDLHTLINPILTQPEIVTILEN